METKNTILDIRCEDCNKVIGKYENGTNETLEMTNDYNICDECGIEICCDCTIKRDILQEVFDEEYNFYVYSEMQYCKRCDDLD